MTESPQAVLEKFFLGTVRGFDRAVENEGEVSLDLHIAEQAVRVRFAGQGLEHLARPLAHLRSPEVPTSPPSLEIMVWHGPPGWVPPEAPWKLRQQWFLGEIVGLQCEQVLINYHDQSGLLCIFHQPTRRALYWIPTAEALPSWEVGSPFRLLFHWWARSIGGHMAHAAAVGRDGRGVLLVGRGGSGKSTLAMNCLDAGMEYVGDDYVLLMRNPTPMAWSIYNSAKLHAGFLEGALPHWKERVATHIGPEQKALFYVHECDSGALRNQLAVRGVIVPKVTPEKSAAMRSRPPSVGLLALAPSTIFQLAGSQRSALPFFTHWMRGLPVYQLDVGRDLAAGPRELLAFLAAIKEDRTV